MTLYENQQNVKNMPCPCRPIGGRDVFVKARRFQAHTKINSGAFVTWNQREREREREREIEREREREKEGRREGGTSFKTEFSALHSTTAAAA